MAGCLWVGLMLFCIPAPIYAIGWIGVGQDLGGISISPLVAYTSRAIGLCVLGFGVGYARLPTSLENAAALVPSSVVQRMWLFVMPVIVWSVAAASAFVAAVTYADRDVSSLLLQPGSSRLVLNFYLALANAPSAAISLLAVIVLMGAALSVAAAAAGPLLVWGRRG
jgi:ABC-type spermidine/putrescine transport system permease subunit II